MPRETIIDNEFATLWYYPEENILHHQFHKHTAGDDFRNMLLAGLKIMENRHCIKYLSDDTNNLIISAEDSAWSKEVYEPRSRRAGWKYWAMVLPESPRAQVNLNRLMSEAKTVGIDARTFDTPDAALAWLRSIQG